MKKLISLLVLIVFLFATNSFAQLKAGDTFLGPRVALGGVGKASMGFGASGEYMLNKTMGVGFVGMYSSYSEDYAVWTSKGKWTYSNIYVLGMVTYHYDLFGSPSFDTYGAFNIGYNVASSSWEWESNPNNFPQPASSSVGGLVWGFSATMRYFISRGFAITASAGYGIGYLQIGLDIKL